MNPRFLAWLTRLVPSHDAPPPDDLDYPLTGELKIDTRPVTARWRPGAVMRVTPTQLHTPSHRAGTSARTASRIQRENEEKPPHHRTKRAAARRVKEVARANPAGAFAVVLLGLGGAVYPPVWLLGAGLAVACRRWDRTDRWIGLAGTVLLVIVGTVTALLIGGQRSSGAAYIYEAWIAAGRLSRGAAVLGAAYLSWRLLRGPRPEKPPPWS